jgi:hypothetical protein
MIFSSDIPVVHGGFLKSFVSINLIEGIVRFAAASYSLQENMIFAFCWNLEIVMSAGDALLLCSQC